MCGTGSYQHACSARHFQRTACRARLLRCTWLRPARGGVTSLRSRADLSSPRRQSVLVSAPRAGRTIMRHWITGLAGLIALGLAGPASAQDCPRGDLERNYCDRNGDLVADAPTDPKQLVNPSTLVFAYTPVEDPAVYAKVWDGFIKHLEKVTGKRVVFFAVQSNAAQYEAMRSIARCRRQRRRQSDRGELRRFRAVRDDGRQGRQLRLRNGDNRAGGQS